MRSLLSPSIIYPSSSNRHPPSFILQELWSDRHLRVRVDDLAWSRRLIASQNLFGATSGWDGQGVAEDIPYWEAREGKEGTEERMVEHKRREEEEKKEEKRREEEEKEEENRKSEKEEEERRLVEEASEKVVVDFRGRRYSIPLESTAYADTLCVGDLIREVFTRHLPGEAVPFVGTRLSECRPWCYPAAEVSFRLADGSWLHWEDPVLPWVAETIHITDV